MPYEHRIPNELNPTGDYCVPLYIPLDPQYTGLLLGVLKTLEDLEYYQRDPDFDNENAKVVTEQWRTRTITPLIEAIATAQGCETSENMSHKIVKIDLVTSKTTTSSSYVIVTGSNFNHTPTKPNMIIRVLNITGSNGTSAVNSVEPRFDGNSGDEIGEGVFDGLLVHNLQAVARFEAVEIDVEKEIALYFKTSAGTLSISGATHLIFEIMEYD